MSNKLDIELSGDAQRVIADGRGFDEPTAEDRERVKARWLASIAVAAGVSSFSDTAAAASSGGWAVKGASLALAVAAGIAGLYLALPDAKLPGSEATPVTASPLPAIPAEMPAKLEMPPAEPALAPRELEASPTPLAPNAEREEPVEVVHPKAPSTEEAVESTQRRATKVERLPVVVNESPDEATAPSGQLSEEIALLSRIRAGVRGGAGAQALDLLAEYRKRFERPILGMEAAALNVDALCQTGQRDAARAAASTFRDHWPKSPLEQRVSAACTQF